MKKVLFIVSMLLLGGTMYGQKNVRLDGTTFAVLKKDTKVNQNTKTKYTFKAKDGKEYPIYLSKNGKAFIIRVSKKTGKEYKQYLPEVTEQLKKAAK